MKKHLSLFGSLIAFMMLFAMPAAAQVDEYLMIEGSATVNVKMTGTVTEWPDFWYSLDGGEWIKITEADTRIDVQGYSVSHPLTGYVRFKGNNPSGFNRSSTDYLSIAITGGNPALKGNVMSLIGGDNFSSLTAIPCDYCFYGLFCPNPPGVFSMSGTYHTTSSSTCLAHAKEMVLPATELKPYCYAYMFAYNTGLYDSPELPAMVMQPYCYAHMFEYCMNNFCSQTAYNSGTRLPNLPSQQLAEGCYAFMFNMCPSIYNGENDWYCLPAEELAPRCYEGMFGTYRNSYYRYFKSLEIMATSLQDRCGNDIENCMKRMLNYNPMAQNAGQFGRGALNVRMYWTDWGNTTAGTAPTYGWFSGYLYSSCTFNYQKGLDPLTKVAKGSNSSNTMSSLFPYMCTLQENEFTYLTFDCKSNGGTWETGCTYNEDLRRVVRSDYTAKTVPADPVKEGVSFKGWYTAPTGGTKVEKAVILKQTTAQTYYAQFGEGDDNGGEGGGDNPEDEGDTDLSNIKMTRGTLDFPTYYSFAIEGENKAVKVRLSFNTQLKTNITNYLSAFDASQSYILPAGGAQRQIASASVANVAYLGDAYRAAHLVATVTDTEGNTYNIDIFTNEELNYATYKDVIGTNYKSIVETSWRTCNPFHIYGTQNNEMDRLIYRNRNGRHILYTYHGDYGYTLYYEVLHVQIELFPDASKPGNIPTGIYPINATQEIGTAFIGRCPEDILIYEQNDRQPYCGSFVQYELQATENDIYPNRDVWVLRDGYVEVVNVDEKYWVHVHAYADAHRTTNEECAVIDYTACLDGDDGVTYTPVAVTLSAQTEGGAPLDDAVTMLLKDAESWTSPLAQGEHTLFAGNTVTLNAAKPGYEFSHWLINGSRVDGNNIDYTVTGSANEIIAVFTGDGNGGDEGEDPDPETPIVSADADVTVYQNVSKTTTKILYNLDPRQGKDGLWYKPTDMGYGIAWADRNVGAASESATGDYYNWGKTVVGPLPLSSTGYANVTSLNPGFTLPAKDDVATVKMGNDWHTPNYDEWNELITKAVGHGNLLANPDDEDLYINMPPTGHYDYYDGSSEVSPWLNYKSAAFLWTSELLQINTPGHWTNAGMVTNYTGSFEMNMGYIHLAAPVRAVYTPPFVTYTLTIRVGSYEYRYICQQGQKVTVTAIATETGAEFVKWEEDGLTDAVRTFTMTGDMAYTAIFTDNSEPEQPETPEMSPDAEVSVYQSVTETTMKILYDLRPRQGKDGLWYTPVDMGYGVAWADRNVGAGSVGALGDYFRWGDPVAGTSFSSDHQRNLDVTGYRTYDRLTDTQDAAIVNMGIEWRMPDEEDLYQLKEQSVITDNNTFTNKYDNTMYIVLPGGGYMGSKQYDNGWQYYWSRQFGQHGANSCSQGAGYGKEEYNSFALVRTGNNEYYVQTMDKDDCLGNETYLGMQVRGMFVPMFDVCTLTVNVEGYQYIYLCQDGQNVTVTAVANEGYEFDRWTEDNNTEAVRTFTVTGNMTYTATFKQAKQEYNIIYKDKGGAEFSGTHASGYPTVHTYGTATTLAGASKEGYNFLGWYLTADCTGSAVTTLGATAYTGDITLYASWEETVVEPEDPEDPENDELHIILYEDKTPDYYTDFSNKYNGKRATTVTYNRQFEKAKWSTLCLPFNVNAALLSVSKMTSRVYEFRYTEGNEESGLTLYFAQAKMLTAGKGYIVNANAKLAEKTQFVFPNVVINTEADINSGFDIINLEGYNSQGDVYLVGVLRTGVLKGSETGNRYMGLKNNKIYYPNQDEGTNMRAYRGMFRSSVDINVSKVRIVVEGEDGEQVSELEVVNGELKEAEPVRKYIENGVLYIERNGRRYTAQGALINDK